MTFDNEDELLKIKSVYPDAECILRIKPPVEMSVQSFSSKFGANRRGKKRMLGERVASSIH